MSLDLDQELHTAIGVAELLYGPRDATFHLLPVAYHHESYARSFVSEAGRTISVKLADPTAFEDKETEARYELWHEAVHCLAPRERADTLWFEEGVALRFGLTHSPLTQFQKVNNRRALREPWKRVLHTFDRLNPTDAQIKQIRDLSRDRLFDAVTEELIIRVCDEKARLARKLCQRLPNYR